MVFQNSNVGKVMLVVVLFVIFQLVSYYFLLRKNESSFPKYSHEIFNNTELTQNDPVVLNYIREFHLTPPSGKIYEGKNPDPSQYQDEILAMFKNKKNGFFIEAGANDGLYLSNTLELERRYNWTGILIEPNPFMLVKLRLRNRNAWIADICLSLTGFPNKVRFIHRIGEQKWWQGIGKMEHDKENSTLTNAQDSVYAGAVECFPLYTLISALNPDHTIVIDYFSLDIEGIEFHVLKSIPFDKLIIKVMSIEFNLIPEGLDHLLEFLKSRKYKLVLKKLVEIFVVHEDYLHEIDVSHFKTA